MEWRKAVALVGFVPLLMSYVVFFLTFIEAYFSPEKMVIVGINKFGEANLEFIFLLITFPFVCFSLYYFLRYSGLEREHFLWASVIIFLLLGLSIFMGYII